MRWIYGILFLWLYGMAWSQAVDMPMSAVRVPAPDPTTLTTDQLRREIGALREIIETRLNGSDKAIELLQGRTDKLPAFISDQILSLKVLHEEKFESVQRQFEERDIRSNKLADAGQLAIKDALQAAKELVANQNTSNEKAIVKNELNTAELLKALDGKIGSVKELIAALDKRFSSVEAIALEQRQGKAETQGDLNIWIGLGGLLIALIVGIIAAAALFIKR